MSPNPRIFGFAFQNNQVKSFARRGSGKSVSNVDRSAQDVFLASGSIGNEGDRSCSSCV